jgi:hypothetical protein
VGCLLEGDSSSSFLLFLSSFVLSAAGRLFLFSFLKNCYFWCWCYCCCCCWCCCHCNKVKTGDSDYDCKDDDNCGRSFTNKSGGEVVEFHIHWWFVLVQLDPIRLRFKILLQWKNLDNMICAKDYIFECLLSLEDPLFSIVLPPKRIYHGQVHDVHDWLIPSQTGFFITFWSRCACYMCNYAYSTIPRDKENSFEIIKELNGKLSHHHDNGNSFNCTSTGIDLINTNLQDKI